MNYLSLEEAKKAFNVTTFQIVRNDNSGKLSILLPTGKFLKVQQNLDKSKEIAFMYEDEMEDGCLVNVNRNSPLNNIMDI
jgi:invasion protein IalB